MPTKPNREYRSMSVLLPTENDKRFDTSYYVSGYATTFNDPYVLWEWEGRKFTEEIDRNALIGADMSDVIMQYDHGGRVLARLSNNTLGIEPDDRGLFTFADLSKSSAAKDMYEDISAGLVTRMSWAFTVAEDEIDERQYRRIIRKIRKVYDVSAVSIPANPGTDISARAWCDGVIAKELQELQRRQKELELEKAKYFYFFGGDNK